MNDITRELAHRAFEFAYQNCKDVDHKVGSNDTIFVSFAMGRYHELIVQECARWLSTREFASPAALKQHFGVK